MDCMTVESESSELVLFHVFGCTPKAPQHEQIYQQEQTDEYQKTIGWQINNTSSK